MQRRAYLGSLGTTGAILAAGCLNRGNSDTVLDSPDRRGDSEDIAYPAYGQELPEVTVPSPLHDRDVTTTEFVGDRHVLMTFVFTRCHGPCPTLTSTLAQIQSDAAKNDYEDEVAFLPVTFDPAYDTADRLRTFSEERGADPDAENWQFLRPESHDTAQEVVNDTFGIGFEKTDAYTEDTEGAAHSGESEDDQDGEMKDMFVHVTLIILANEDGYVERAYRKMPGANTILDDLATVRGENGGGFL
ncbi:hypothetical protein HALLA_03590 (plasmid) [Halostagnicola larsenii XH-48]|uniref:Thioredoxin domain-containing protein n=1 Tax=Halostagnicola larsenii XH-48 TaxID=797299 RepID=W0JW49_9EURY|nr:SCO family protein [Halostagnicola larsenii]AHG01485.1 hypothetical protein HALLA_03590 [Halostagnicola larsenii XH-48]